MRTVTFLSVLLVTASAARSVSLFGGQTVLDDDLSVPGDNPLVHCKKTTEDILTIDYVDLDPNPPKAGITLKVTAKGNFSEDIEQDAYVNLHVKYGIITLINTKADLCEQLKNVDKECPVKKGETTIEKDIDLPKQIPPGKYSVIADVYTNNNTKITCLEAHVEFKV